MWRTAKWPSGASTADDAVGDLTVGAGTIFAFVGLKRALVEARRTLGDS